ncbi:tRNA lysidine(34) synthetase TilS [Aneurinibacillus sp. Ricciae_BoGa-3]|uniref:tRNA lysidine(34) synthetase TilS n=1 Tax=Aneurinibacillus sp. Ricciae_BoGa-3 TaxID=3022697 RepID=UPI0023408DA9|nr:tRNA lysidine(34) synthetase TilS [Aneurinibacillus sp. Ricciae_BoGa-3]WCK54641.1 tRNA lysidine(34) synthetase TilS [Aneurinibacillus sp. Ricciae_BoGa-3]
MNELLHILEKTIKDHQLFTEGDKILAAVSGGPDSIALLHALASLRKKYGWQVGAAHLNHQFRGQDAVEDSLYVEQMCRMLHVPCYVESINVPLIMQETGMGTQEAAREVRYDFLQTVAENEGYTKIATAHQADDQVETMLIRLIRGTGIEGLAGIPLKRMVGQVEIVRPMIEITRHEINAYCEAHAIIPRQDPSNFKGKYLRNRIRLNLIPLMKEENPSLANSFLHLSEVVRDENAYMTAQAETQLRLIIDERKPHKIIIQRPGFLRCPIALQRRMIKLILSYLLDKPDEAGFIHIEKIRKMIEGSHPSAQTELADGMKVYREYEQVIFSSITGDQTREYTYTLNVPGRLYIPEIGRTVYAFYGTNESIGKLASCMYEVFDSSQIRGKLYVRTRREGDRMTVKGMDGSKKVKDIFIDEKIPRNTRATLPIITDESRILWIPGVKRSNEYLPDTVGEGILYIAVE